VHLCRNQTQFLHIYTDETQGIPAFSFCDTIFAQLSGLWEMGRAALLRRRVRWPRSNAALPSGTGVDYYREM
jgi:hypothetical protein